MQLILDGLYQVTDAGISSLATNCTTLKHLSILGLNRVTDDSIVTLAANCLQMEVIDFSPNVGALSAPVSSAKVGDRAFAAIGASMKKLKALHAAGLRRVTDAGIVPIAEGCPGRTAPRMMRSKSCSGSLLHVVCRPTQHCTEPPSIGTAALPTCVPVPSTIPHDHPACVGLLMVCVFPWPPVPPTTSLVSDHATQPLGSPHQFEPRGLPPRD